MSDGGGRLVIRTRRWQEEEEGGEQAFGIVRTRHLVFIKQIRLRNCHFGPFPSRFQGIIGH